jgi:hypothetical protein
VLGRVQRRGTSIGNAKLRGKRKVGEVAGVHVATGDDEADHRAETRHSEKKADR